MKVLLFIGFGMIVGCGNQAKEGRIVLSSQSEDHLTIPEGAFEGAVISKSKVEKAIAEQLDSISKVYDLSMKEKLLPAEVLEAIYTLGSLGLYAFFSSDPFLASFTVETTHGKIYTEINCSSLATRRSMRSDVIYSIGRLTLIGCKSDEVQIDKTLSVQMRKILIDIPETVKIIN